MIENLHFIKSEDGVRTFMTAYTKKGVIQVITDNPFLSVAVEYDIKGNVTGYDVEHAQNVKEYETGKISNTDN
jgi:uncharacterized membrane protein